MAESLNALRPDTPAERFNRKLGLWMFLLYAIAYALFVGVTVYDYRLMGHEAFAGLNVAIVYGFGLIVSAFVLAVIYMVACKADTEWNDQATMTNKGPMTKNQ